MGVGVCMCTSEDAFRLQENVIRVHCIAMEPKVFTSENY